MRWTAANFQIADANHRNTLDVQRRDVFARSCFVRSNPGAEMVLSQKLSEHCARSFVERPAPGQTKNGRFRPPGWRELFDCGWRRRWFRDLALSLRATFGSLGLLFGARIPIVVVGEIAHQLAHAILDALQLVCVQHATLRIVRSQL